MTTTQRYTHLEAEDLQAQVAEMPANGFRVASSSEVTAACIDSLPLGGG